MTVGVLRVFFLNATRVWQHDAAQILGPRRAEDAAPETLRDQAREIAAVIEVRVRQHDRRDVRRLDRQVAPVALAQLLEPLEQPAVDQDPGVPVSSRCFDPVTVRAAPRNVSFIAPLD